MDCSDPARIKATSEVKLGFPRKPRVLLAACGCIAAVKFGLLCRCFIEWAEIRGVITKSSLRFIDRNSIPNGVFVYYDEYEWYAWKRMDIELLQWADIMVIAPLSANTLAKIVGGLSDDLLTSTVQGWDCSKKPIFVAPAMNPFMWENSLTERHCKMCVEERGISLIPPLSQVSTGGEYKTGAMAEPSDISHIVNISYSNFQKKNVGRV
ncbi:hypothetical protein VNO78_15408 [Psophocarpus tetragonolobus]|uniref:phosphopantothenoylcysteine decarboxylase n=1 Tax=Psophocarpus tetragonolobus TaxID=3891 RepID=A0AAN9SEY4_PSOTE